MPQAKIYNVNGEIVSRVELPEKHFGIKVKPGLVHEIVVAQEANARNSVANTKTRGEVSGGGKKPWKQKGTGRARHGSTRSPIWKGGGVTFGPRGDRNFSVKINRKAKGSSSQRIIVCVQWYFFNQSKNIKKHALYRVFGMHCSLVYR